MSPEASVVSHVDERDVNFKPANKRLKIARMLLLSAFLGTLTGLAPDFFFTVIAGGAVFFAFRMWPGALIFTYLLLQPLQELFIESTSTDLRTLDEILVVLVSLSILFGLFVRRPYRLVQDKFLCWAGLFVLSSIVSALANGIPPKVAGSGIFVSCDYLVLFLALIHLPLTPKHARLAIGVTLILGLLTTMVAVVQTFFPMFSWTWQEILHERGMVRVTGLFKHPNDLGYFMLLSLFVAIAASLNSRSILARFMLPVALMGIILSVSRSSYLAVFVGIGTAGVFLSRRLLKVLVTVAIVVVAGLGPLVYEAIAVRIEKFSAEGGDARLTYAKKAVPIFLSAPLLGVGPGRFGGTVAEKFPSPVYAAHKFEFKQTWKTIDSFWIHLLIESGIIGTILFIGLLFGILRACRKANQIPDLDPSVRSLLFATAMMVGAHLLINISSMALEANTTAAPFWILSGVALSCVRNHSSAEPAESETLAA